MQPQWTTRLVDAPASDLLTLAEVAKLFSISEDTLTRLIANGEFPDGVKVGRAKFWDWRAAAYYRLRLEMGSRLASKSAADDSTA